MAVTARALEFFRNRRKKNNSLKKIAHLLPYLFTFANALCGFLAIVKAMDDAWIVAAYCIIIAALMDLFDGRVARLCGSESLLGAELDGLCDGLSFCLAPTMLVYSFYGAALGTLGMIVLGGYLCAGLFRLARFNCNHTKVSSYFVGLSVPVAALCITLCMLYHHWLVTKPLKFLVHPLGMTALIAILAFLMISKVLYPSFKTYRFKMPDTLLHALPLCGIVLICTVRQYPFLLILCLAYIITGFIYYCLQHARRFLILVFYNS